MNQDVDDPKRETPDILGFVGLAFAVLGISTVPQEFRLTCLVCAAFCIFISFHLQTSWPQWARWLLSLFATFFFALVGWAAVHTP